MKEIGVTIGGRNFRIAHEEGQEEEVQHAVTLLDEQARGLVQSNPHITESQLLLLSGLLTAYHARSLEEDYANISTAARAAEQEISKLKSAVIQGEPSEAKRHSDPAINDLKEKIETQNAEISHLNDELTSVNAQLKQADLSEDMAAKISALEAAQKEAEELRTQLVEAESEHSNLKSRISELEGRNGELMTQLDAAKENILTDAQPIESNEELSALRSENKRLSQQLGKANRKLKRRTKILIALSEDLERLAKEDEHKLQLAKLIEENHELRLQLEDVDAVEKIVDAANAESSEQSSSDTLSEIVAGLERLAKK